MPTVTFRTNPEKHNTMVGCRIVVYLDDGTTRDEVVWRVLDSTKFATRPDRWHWRTLARVKIWARRFQR